GIGSCGRELCCSTWLSDFKSVTTTIARYQNLSINQTKLSGQCGRLKCCLNFELDTYLDALQHFPDNAEILETQKGNAVLVKKDIFKNLMWYVLPDSNVHYPLSLETVNKIKSLNQKGQRVDQLETVEVQNHSATKKETELNFVDVVGQISLKSLDKNYQKKRQKEKDQQRQNQPRSIDRNFKKDNIAPGKNNPTPGASSGNAFRSNKPQPKPGPQPGLNKGESRFTIEKKQQPDQRNPDDQKPS
ncbi:MAG: regulatory iron-sulfur-containing complex subunit RicT, partial [Chitinophagaceae bacterium]